MVPVCIIASSIKLKAILLCVKRRLTTRSAARHKLIERSIVLLDAEMGSSGCTWQSVLPRRFVGLSIQSGGPLPLTLRLATLISSLLTDNF